MAKNHKRNRKQKQTRKFPWLLVLLGSGLLLLAAALFVNRSDGNIGGTPKISINQNRIDYGYVKFGETRQFAVKVTNTGEGTLHFTKDPYIEVVEGC